jgi:uncharacterized membrane protein
MASIILAAFERRDGTDAIARDLYALGLTPDDVSVITTESAELAGGRHKMRSVDPAAAGAIIGGVTGLVATLAVWPAVPGLIIGGPIVALLGLGGAATGVITGGLIGALTELGVPADEAEAYEHLIHNGGMVVGVPDHDDVHEQEVAVFTAHGAAAVRVMQTKMIAEDGSSLHRMIDTNAARHQPTFGERVDGTHEKDE